MNRPEAMSRGGVALVVALPFVALTLTACQSNAPPPTSPVFVRTSGPSFAIPDDVQRIAVFYPRSSNPDFLEAYQRLEGAVFQLKDKRATLKIVDRLNLAAVMSEQRFQVAGTVTDDSAVRIGHMLGVDSVLLYTIEGPTLRDRFYAHVRPITLTTKIIRVESAEVVYHNVVTAHVDGGWDWVLSDHMDYHQLNRAALEQGISQTVFDLQRAFE
jgi:hypothetical protein